MAMTASSSPMSLTMQGTLARPANSACPLPAMPAHKLVALRARRAHRQRHEHAVLCDALRQPLHLLVVFHLEGMAGKGVYERELNLRNALKGRVVALALGREQVVHCG